MKKISKQLLEEMEQAFDEIQQPRTPYVLRDLVVNTKHTDQQAYAQCVLEMNIARDNLLLAEISVKDKLIEMQQIENEIKQEKDKLKKKRLELDIQKKEVELSQTRRAQLGASREFTYLFNMWRKRGKRYTREDLNLAQPEEYHKRLTIQAQHDIIATGRISQSNCEGLRQIGVDPVALTHEIQLGLENKSPEPAKRDAIEQKYLEEGKLRTLLIIPSKDRLTSAEIDKLIGKVDFPTNCEFRIENIHSSPVADNYNSGFEKALKEGCTHIVTLETDQILEHDSLIKLFDFALDNPDCAVGARYPKRQKTREGVHIKLSGGHRRFLPDDGKIHEVKTLAMGLSIYPTEIIKQLDFPFCKTTDSLSQDSYLSQKIRDKGYKLLVDTNIKIAHQDTDGTIYR